MPYDVQQKIRDDCPEINQEDAQGRPNVLLNAGCRPMLDPKKAAVAVAQIRSDAEIGADLTRSLVDDDQKILQFQVMQESAAQLHAALEATIPTRGKP